VFDSSGTGHAAQCGSSCGGCADVTRRYWGSYVVLTPAGAGWCAARDPSGGLACYHAQLGDGHFFTSQPHLLVDCGLISGAIDWSEMWRSLSERSFRGRRTGIRAIDELLPGTCLATIGGKVERRPIWNAWDHACRTPPEVPAEALREALCSTLRSWGDTLHRPLIEISGGLDSAIVAAGVSRGSASASLITFAAASGDPDETLYARAIADHLALELTIVDPQVADVDLRRSLSADLPRPNARAFTQAADALSLRHAQAIGADAFVSGGGGDDVFCYLRSILPAVDRLRAEGVRGMLSSAMDIAIMNHSTFWEALHRIVRRLIRRRSSRRPLDLRFLNHEAAPRPVSRDAERPSSRSPGKAEHVESIRGIHNYLEGHARATFAPIVSPLLSQPIVECCLAIPTWHWCAGGRNRAVARHAFRDLLPRSVLERRSKGHFDGFCCALFETNRELIRSMLLGGHLARQRLLDCTAIEAALSCAFPGAETVTRLLTLVDAESWAASWASPAGQRL
jgi:asparagine synthase (glutamine-hydrolysing)